MPRQTPPVEPEQRPIRRRPKNRRAQIAAASAAAFGSLGYHQVSMETIASRIGISSAALYRHYPSKYALFREELLRLSEVAAAAVELPERVRAELPGQQLDLVLDSLIAATVANRTTVALTRWEARYLDDTDQQTMNDGFASAISVLRGLVGEIRPELSSIDRAVRSVSMPSVFSSIGDHHVAMSAKSLALLLHSTCLDLVHAEPTGPDAAAAPLDAVSAPPLLEHELVLRKAVELFHRRGYPNVSVEEIAAAAGLSSGSAVYRFYRSKSDLLTAAFRRAADSVAGAIGPAVAASSSPAEALSTLVERYVTGSFADRELTFVYYAEFWHIPAQDRAVLRNIQRASVTEWAGLLVAVRPELTTAQAKILVHAALGLVVDLGRVFGDDQRICPPERVIGLMRAVLFGDTRGASR